MEKYKSEEIETPKVSRRGSGSRRPLSVFLGSAILAWGGLLLFTYFVPPRNIPLVVLAFLLLSVALLSTFIPLIYLFRLLIPKTRLAPSFKGAIREAALFSAWVIFNLLLLVLRSWNILALLTSFGIIIVLEILMLGER